MEKSVKSALQSELTISSKNDESTNTSQSCTGGRFGKGRKEIHVEEEDTTMVKEEIMENETNGVGF